MERWITCSAVAVRAATLCSILLTAGDLQATRCTNTAACFTESSGAAEQNRKTGELEQIPLRVHVTQPNQRSHNCKWICRTSGFPAKTLTKAEQRISCVFQRPATCYISPSPFYPCPLLLPQPPHVSWEMKGALLFHHSSLQSCQACWSWNSPSPSLSLSIGSVQKIRWERTFSNGSWRFACFARVRLLFIS